MTPEEARRRDREQYRQNREHIIARKSARMRLYAERRNDLTGEHVKAQYDRQHGRCYWCGKNVRDKYHVDHVVPLYLGGDHIPENIVISCPPCNQHKQAKHPMDFAGVMF